MSDTLEKDQKQYQNAKKEETKKPDITVIGAAIIDVLAGPVPENLFEKNTHPVENIALSFGGNALNEAAVLARAGINVNLVSLFGKDDAGARVLDFCKENGIETDTVVFDPEIATGVNIVLIDEKGERRFLTNPKGSLRKLSKEHVLSQLSKTADIVCFSGMFASPLLDTASMEEIFRTVKEKDNAVLAVDMTNPKNGESIDDLADLWKYADYFFPNESELQALKGKDLSSSIEKLLEYGVKNVVLKKGAKGCTIYSKEKTVDIPAYPVEKAVDTTGAGDTFAAGFLSGLKQGYSKEECAMLGAAAASCCVEKTGATDGVKDWKEVLRRFEVLKQKIQKSQPEIH
jgi:sugar/nucleoside kinase (ribokinase family)